VKTVVEIQGGKDLFRKLTELERRLSRKIAAQALRAGAKVVLADAKATAPRRSGLLAKSLKVRAGKRAKNMVRFQVETAEGNYKGAAFYGAFVHFGHRAGSRRDARLYGKTRKWVQPHPYLADAFERTKDAALREIIKTLQDGIAAVK
jgi:HK97 gp10 family phage protein